jgi:pyrroloquinoline quinone biosynthesis protein D
MTAAATRPLLTPDSVPRLPRHVMLKHDKTRERWVILVPERVLVPDDIAVAVLQRVDGKRPITEIAADLAVVSTAPVEVILADVVLLLQDLADKGYVALPAPEGARHAG